MEREREIPNILIADDDGGFRGLVEELILDMGLKPVPVSDGVEALERSKDLPFALALVDLKMPGMDGIDLLSRLKDDFPDLPVIIVTGHGSIETAVEAMKIGAVDYITKPSSIAEIRKTVSGILERWEAAIRARPSNGSNGRFGIIGRAKAMGPVYDRIEVMRQADNTVLISGESGVGKELVAKAIHQHGDRRDAPFIPIDCSVLGLNIVESELFGHQKGAFTDAHYTKTGLLKLAGRGTVFLDEITEIPLPIQAKLLRAIQEREIRPVGAPRVEKIEARIVAATNRQLEKAVSEGAFREDLFYRLHVIPIFVPPLRERKEDIPLLVEHFIGKHGSEKHPVKGVTPDAMDALLAHDWPGNIRELENVVQQAIALGSGEWVRPIDLPKSVRGTDSALRNAERTVRPLKDLEREAILKAIRAASGNKVDAARSLGIGKTTLYEKLKKYKKE